MKFSIIAALFLFLSSKLFAQSPKEEFKSILIKKTDGAEIVYSSDDHSFTLDILSKNIKPTDNPHYLTVDNKVLQYVFIGNDALQKNEGAEAEQKGQLLGYIKYELDYIKSEVKLRITGVRHDWIVINNKVYLLWYYNMPADNQSILKQINLSTLCFAHVLTLNTPFEKNDNLDDDKGLLLKVAQTLKQNDFKMDFTARFKELQNN